MLFGQFFTCCEPDFCKSFEAANVRVLQFCCKLCYGINPPSLKWVFTVNLPTDVGSQCPHGYSNNIQDCSCSLQHDDASSTEQSIDPGIMWIPVQCSRKDFSSTGISLGPLRPVNGRLKDQCPPSAFIYHDDSHLWALSVHFFNPFFVQFRCAVVIVLRHDSHRIV